MTLNRWDPVRDLLSFQERLNRLVDSRQVKAFGKPRMYWSPLMDLIETPEVYIFRLELPGVGKENISIEIYGRRMTISGESTLDSEPQLAAYHTAERAHGPFQRSFDVPRDADLDKAEAEYVDGILQISLPKSEEERERILTVVTLR